MLLIAVLALQIINADKQLMWTDKMQHVYVPAGESWTINLVSVSFTELRPGVHVSIWIQTPPYAPFRNPVTGAMIGCASCLTLLREPLDKYLFTLTTPIRLEAGSRISFAVSPDHGGLETPLDMIVRLQVDRRRDEISRDSSAVGSN